MTFNLINKLLKFVLTYLYCFVAFSTECNLQIIVQSEISYVYVNLTSRTVGKCTSVFGIFQARVITNFLLKVVTTVMDNEINKHASQNRYFIYKNGVVYKLYYYIVLRPSYKI